MDVDNAAHAGGAYSANNDGPLTSSSKPKFFQ